MNGNLKTDKVLIKALFDIYVIAQRPVCKDVTQKEEKMNIYIYATYIKNILKDLQ